MNQEEYIKFLEERLKHSDEQLEKAMEMLAKLMSKMKDAIQWKLADKCLTHVSP